jgi:DtxR family transcriptional regulator, Mn-dependent transcriptional regulator
MELLERLTRRQVDALRVVGTGERPDAGVALKEIASSLGVRSPSALAYLTTLEQRGLVLRYRGKTRLSPRGRFTLDEYRRHHRIAESMFSQLGLSPEDTCKAAREVDLAISHKTVERVCAAEGHPVECPHGEPITPCFGQKAGA